MARALNAAQDYDVEGILFHSDCPVSTIWKANDRVTPVSEWERGIRLVKHETLRTVARCRHLSHGLGLLSPWAEGKTAREPIQESLPEAITHVWHAGGSRYKPHRRS
jgi:hypothetical protein